MNGTSNIGQIGKNDQFIFCTYINYCAYCCTVNKIIIFITIIKQVFTICLFILTFGMQLYLVFPRNELPFTFILTVGIRWFIGLVGFLLNFSLVYVTWKTKKFRQLCNFLIAATAFFSGLFGLSLSIGWALLLSDRAFMFEGHCTLLQTVPLLCRNLGLSSLFWIGFDRLISALFIKSFLHRHKSCYSFLIIIGSSLHSGFIVISVFTMAINYPQSVVLCLTHDDTYVGPMSLTLLLVNVMLSVHIFFVYMLLAFVVKFKKETSVSHQITRLLLRSLMAIMVVVVAGFTLNNFVTVLFDLKWIKMTKIAKAYTSMALSCLLAMAYASNAPMLFLFSTEYRKAFWHTFGPLLKRWHLIGDAYCTAKSIQKVQQQQRTEHNDGNNLRNNSGGNRMMLVNNNNNNDNKQYKQHQSRRSLAKVEPLAN